ncbi:hypothetical protein KFK09_011509 [Dendrobium nobile]|uniref:Uncharacterized protein n=1 Tax=Dendrobium nobile TaxID=94219 RepID=A0A8T3BIE0_DENNO|nr:hypothetical protein KFK09_011509 [Dendrobium nobile]
MLLRQEDAEETMIDAPKFETDAATQFFGALSNAYHLSIRAQVDMATGRFESAVSLAQMAARIDPGSREIAAIARKARSVASARSMGNDLFKASKFEEACLAYGSGLNHDPHNTILLCNRAACRSKLGQWEKAIEDCNVVLNLRPKYNKARLRRADCNVKLDRWEDSLKDYEVLALEMPGDETVNKALQDAKAHVRRRQSEGLEQMADDSAVHITTKDQFRSVITSCGLSLALFYDQSDEDSKGILHHLEQLCKQHTSVTFLKILQGSRLNLNFFVINNPNECCRDVANESIADQATPILDSVNSEIVARNLVGGENSKFEKAKIPDEEDKAFMIQISKFELLKECNEDLGVESVSRDNANMVAEVTTAVDSRTENEGRTAVMNKISSAGMANSSDKFKFSEGINGVCSAQKSEEVTPLSDINLKLKKSLVVNKKAIIIKSSFSTNPNHKLFKELQNLGPLEDTTRRRTTYSKFKNHKRGFSPTAR